MSVDKKKSAAETAGALVPQRTTGISEQESDFPLIINSDPKTRKIWGAANDDERKAGLLLCEFQDRFTQSEVLARFDFADRWNTAFPKANKKLYERGMEAVKIGAELAGMGKSSVYSLLRTTGFYKRSGYDALNKKAVANGVEISWYALLLIVERLENHTEARTKVEREIVKRRMTIRELKQFIDTIAPETMRKASETALEKELTVTQQFVSMVGSFKKLSHARGKFEQIMEDLNDSFDGTPEQAKMIIEQASALIGTFEEIQDFMDAKVMFVTQMRDAAQALIDGEGRKKAVKNSAEKIRKQITEEKTQHQKKESARAVATVARGDIDDTVIADLDDESTNATDDELSEIDDEIQVDDDDNGDIFDEIGNIH
jgi:hypothetical protein